MKKVVLHYLAIVSGILSAISGFSALFHIIPGKLGHLLCAVLGLVGALAILVHLLTQEVESGTPLVKAIPQVAKEVADVVEEVEQVEKAAEPFAKKGK